MVSSCGLIQRCYHTSSGLRKGAGWTGGATWRLEHLRFPAHSSRLARTSSAASGVDICHLCFREKPRCEGGREATACGDSLGLGWLQGQEPGQVQCHLPQKGECCGTGLPRVRVSAHLGCSGELEAWLLYLWAGAKADHLCGAGSPGAVQRWP